jgi:hypothetical protein
MLGIFGRKKIGEDQMAKIFVNAMWNISHEAFDDIAEMVNEDPEFVHRPAIDSEHHATFFFIVVAGNLKFLPKRLEGAHSRFIIVKIYERIAELFDTSSGAIERYIKELQAQMSRLNQPSKNTLYGMSKLFFHECKLYEFQEAYYRDIQAPNPLILKRLDAIFSQFLWDWEIINEEYRIVH